jgi:O-antigen ligase/tetratricopeptide (TPR) repeat protein
LFVLHWLQRQCRQWKGLGQTDVKNFLIWVFIVALCLSPWPIGGNYPFTRTVLLAILSVVFLIATINFLCSKPFRANFTDAIRFESGKSRQRIPKVVWVLLLGIGCTVLQAAGGSPLVPSPADQWSSSDRLPGNPALPSFGAGVTGNDMASAQPDDFPAVVDNESNLAVQWHAASFPGSVYPAATRRRLVDLLLATAAFVFAALIFRSQPAVGWLMASIMVTGVGLSAFGIIQKLSFEGRVFNGRVFGVYELLFGGDPFGPFVNGNNAAGFLLITFSAGLFFIANQLFSWHRSHRHHRDHSSQLISPNQWDDNRNHASSWWTGFVEMIAVLQPKHLYFLATIAVIVAGVLMTLSRGGIVAMCVLVVVAFLMIGRTHWKSSLALAIVIMVAGISIVTYADQSSAIGTELESFAEISAASEVRLLHWYDALPFAMEHLIWGVGNGTYRYVSPSFQSFYYPRVFAHAESVYVETFVEMGFVGVAILLVTVVLLLFYCIVLLNRISAFDRSLGIAGMGCLVGQATIGFLDFGLYQAPNSILTAAMMGAVASRACCVPIVSSAVGGRAAAGGDDGQSESAGWFGWLGTAVLLLAMTTATAWAVYESWGIESLRLAARQIDLFDGSNKQSKAPRTALDADGIESLLKTALAIRPDDAEVRIELGELSIARARMSVVGKAKSELQKEVSELQRQIEKLETEAETVRATTDSDVSEGDLVPNKIAANRSLLEQLKAIDHQTFWVASAPISLHQRFRQNQRKFRDPATVSGSVGGSETIGMLEEAYRQFSSAEQWCPWLTLPPLRMAQLAGFYAYGDDALTNGDGLKKERQFIRVALDRSFTDTRLLYNCGFLALNSGNQELAVELWAKCLRHPHLKVHERAIVSLCIQEMPMNLFFEQVLPQNPHDLIRIASKYFGREELMLPKRILLTHTKSLINKSEDLSDFQRDVLLAQTAVLDQQHRLAVGHFQSALKTDPDDVPWRFTYARSLYEIEDYDEALRQLKICQLAPDFRQNQVRSLIIKIRRNR